MRVEYQLSERDFVSAALFGVRKRTRFAVLQLYFFPVLGVIILATAVFSGIENGNWSAVAIQIIFSTLFLFVPLIYPFQFRKVFRKTPLLQERRVLTVDDDGMQFASVSADTHLKWAVFIRFSENKEAFILFQQGNQIFVPIPKRDIEPNKIDEFRSLLLAHLPCK